MGWRGDRTFPASYILFFVLMFFLLGEQLTALPIYIVGPGLGGEGPDKLHILDLAPTDALHRPLFYLLFGVISWLLFRLLSWPLVWISAFAIWNVFHWLLPEQGGAPDLTLGVFIGVGVFAVVPFLIYRAVGRRWGGKGRRNAIIIAAAINVLLLVFFAYQIYGLNNSYRYEPSSQGSLVRSSTEQNGQPNGRPAGPETYAGSILTTPQVEGDKMPSKPEGEKRLKSTSDAISPYGRLHLPRKVPGNP